MSRKLLVTRVWVTLSLLTGCATFQAKPLSPADTASAFESRSLNSPKLREFLERSLHHEVIPWPPQSWDFPMLTLAALYYHPDLEVAKAEWEAAKATIITAGEIPNPAIAFTPQYDAHSPQGVPPWTLGFNLNIPIETAGKRGYRIARAEQISETAARNVATVVWQVRSRLRRSLLNLYAPSQLQAYLERQVSIQETLSKLMGNRLAVGEVSRPDLTLAHISLDQTRLLLAEAQKQQAEARVQLADALGLPVAALDEAAISCAFLERLPGDRLSLLSAQLELALAMASRLNALVEAQHSLGLLEDALQHPLQSTEALPGCPETNPEMTNRGKKG